MSRNARLQFHRGSRTNRPARLGAAGYGFGRRAHHEGCAAPRAGRQGQTPTGSQGHGLRLAPAAHKNCADRSTLQRLLPRRQQACGIAHPYDQHVFWMQAPFVQPRPMQVASLLRRQFLKCPEQRSVSCRTRRQTQRKGIRGHSIGGGLGMNLVQAVEARSGVQICIDPVNPERKSFRLAIGLMTRQLGQTRFQLLDLKGRRHKVFLLCSPICLSSKVESQGADLRFQTVKRRRLFTL